MEYKKKLCPFLRKCILVCKKIKEAIKLAHKIPYGRLKVLDGVRFNFNMTIRLTFSPKISFEGMVEGSKKRNLLTVYIDLYFLFYGTRHSGSQLRKAFYGCPVFATPYGSLLELINKDVGFLSTNTTKLAL